MGRVGAEAFPRRPAAGAGIDGEVRKGAGVWRVGVGFARRLRGSGGCWACLGVGWGFVGRVAVLGGDQLRLQLRLWRLLWRRLQRSLLRRFHRRLPLQCIPLQRRLLQRLFNPWPLLGTGGGQQPLQSHRWLPWRAGQLLQQGPQLGRRQGQGAVEGGGD